ncbi:MAG: AAA family ATPase [Candidatus Omnitrophota bacterium]|nr:AAA family ATPase [Candidatus Omnitrophota bacterium]MBU1928455.1 AAA family ATPase [Candidatus Omnitrophota bacterium]MBU2035472.1 AAA family ATPase [Candidatus Omnitrophota bacterium]MBU2221076.1 AAA family ATPase [Candidatus Omnitrophota bacterium]MBU2258755.1 AAA family ATPase [Candidatus Omnitrophota bacterium]
MYEDFWGLKEKPFENTPDPRFIYYSQKHKEALARLLYVVREHKGAALLTGEFGSGKTLLSRVLWHELQQENRYHAVFILNPRLTALEFIQEITHQLTGGQVSDSKVELFHQLHKIFYSNFNVDKHTVIVIDEAQAIQGTDIFEELRLLLNFQLDNAFLLTIIMIGQPELKSVIANLPQLTQRMAVKYHLTKLDEFETREYILHRLEVAGSTRPVFEDDCFREIYLAASGTPRKINTVCDLALLIGFGSGLKIIDRKTIVKITEDLKYSESDVPTSSTPSAYSDGQGKKLDI